MHRRVPDSSSSPRLRPATRADVEVLCRLRLALFRELGRAPADRDGEFLVTCRVAYEKFFDESRVLAWLAECADETAIGTLSVLVHNRLPTPASLESVEGYVIGVYTVPEWRGCGVATQLMNVALEECRHRGMPRVRLHTSEMGRPLYAALGFEARGDAMERRL